MDSEKAKQIMATLSTDIDAVIGCYSKEENHECRRFLHATGRRHASEKSYLNGVGWNTKRERVIFLFNKGTTFGYDPDGWGNYITRRHEELAKKKNAYYTWSAVLEMLNDECELNTPSDQEVSNFLFGD